MDPVRSRTHARAPARTASVSGSACAALLTRSGSRSSSSCSSTRSESAVALPWLSAGLARVAQWLHLFLLPLQTWGCEAALLLLLLLLLLLKLTAMANAAYVGWRRGRPLELEEGAGGQGGREVPCPLLAPPGLRRPDLTSGSIADSECPRIALPDRGYSTQ